MTVNVMVLYHTLWARSLRTDGTEKIIDPPTRGRLAMSVAWGGGGGGG